MWTLCRQNQARMMMNGEEGIEQERERIGMLKICAPHVGCEGTRAEYYHSHTLAKSSRRGCICPPHKNLIRIRQWKRQQKKESKHRRTDTERQCCRRHRRMHRREQHINTADENPIKQNRSHVRIESMKNYMVVHIAYTQRKRDGESENATHT